MELLPEYDPRIFFAAERTLLAWLMRSEPFEGSASPLVLMLAGLLVVLGAAMVVYLLV
jgi:hypothetical protein